VRFLRSFPLLFLTHTRIRRHLELRHGLLFPSKLLAAPSLSLSASTSSLVSSVGEDAKERETPPRCATLDTTGHDGRMLRGGRGAAPSYSEFLAPPLPHPRIRTRAGPHNTHSSILRSRTRRGGGGREGDADEELKIIILSVALSCACRGRLSWLGLPRKTKLSSSHANSNHHPTKVSTASNSEMIAWAGHR